VKKPICPRCLNYIPNNETPGMYPGALSRTDDKTEICSECGVSEAMEMFYESLKPEKTSWPQVDWYEEKIEAMSDEELSTKFLGFLVRVSHNSLLPISIREKARDYVMTSSNEDSEASKDEDAFLRLLTDAMFEITPPGYRLVGSYSEGKSTYYYIKEHSGREISTTNR